MIRIEIGSGSPSHLVINSEQGIHIESQISDLIRMLLEAEIKVYADSLQAILKRLSELDAEFLTDQIEIDSYFSHPSRDFGKTDEALRIRLIRGYEGEGVAIETEYKTCELCYKGPKIDSGSKTREEYSVQIIDPGYMEELLDRLGFKKVRDVKKRRRIYDYKGFTICADDVEGLGTFVEIEKILLNDFELDSTLSDIRILLKEQFGLERFERRSYLEMLMERDS